MKPGYVLIEILVALVLGSIIMAALFTTFFQVNKAVKLADQVVEFDARAVLVRYQLERDLAGVFVPYELAKQQETTTEKRVTQKVQTGTEKTETVLQDVTKKETLKKEEPVERSFYAEMQDGNLKMLTFITANPLPAYNTSKPRIARVTYHLVPEQQRSNMPPSYRLMREEQRELKPVQQKTETVSGAELVRGIKSLKVDYRVRPAEQEKDQKKTEQIQQGQQQTTQPEQKKSEAKKERPAYEKFQVWSKESIEKTKQNVPQFVDVSITFWDRLHKKDRTFECKLAIPVQDPVRPPEKKVESKEMQGKPDSQQKPGQVGAPGQLPHTETQTQSVGLAPQLLYNLQRDMHFGEHA
jgi:prepilin-type N-terminal cleavage/methylation domain-containing protein